MGDRRTATDPHAAPRIPDPAARRQKALHAVLPSDTQPNEGAKRRRVESSVRKPARVGGL